MYSSSSGLCLPYCYRGSFSFGNLRDAQGRNLHDYNKMAGKINLITNTVERLHGKGVTKKSFC